MKKLALASFLTAAVVVPGAVFAQTAAPAAPAAAPAAPAADAAPAGPWTFGGSLDLTSDYRFRGISQTYKLPSWQGEFDLSHSSGFYASTAGQNVSGNEYFGGDTMEWDFWGGYKFEVVKDIPLDFGVYEYFYDGSKVPVSTALNSNKRYNTTEVYGDITAYGLMVKLNYALTDMFGTLDQNGASSKGSWYLDFTYNYDFTKETHLVAHVGRQQFKGSYAVSPSYTDYKLGASVDSLGLNWAAAIIGTNAKTGTGSPYVVDSVTDGSPKTISKATVVLTVTKSF